jgi:uncharacterized protein YegP (UPF0339 family)
MSYRNKTYVIFSGDEDIWAYRLMKAWHTKKHIDFNFYDAHNLKPLTDRASDETVKARLRERFANAKQAIVLIGYNTKNLYKFVRWEIEFALDLDLPIIAVNLNGMRTYDPDLCPPILRDKYVIHVSYNARIIKYALDYFPLQYQSKPRPEGVNWYCKESAYREVGLVKQLRRKQLSFVIYLDESDQFRWCLVNQDNQMLGDSGVSYPSARECRMAILNLKKEISQASIEDTTRPTLTRRPLAPGPFR